MSNTSCRMQNETLELKFNPDSCPGKIRHDCGKSYSTARFSGAEGGEGVGVVCCNVGVTVIVAEVSGDE